MRDLRTFSLPPTRSFWLYSGNQKPATVIYSQEYRQQIIDIIIQVVHDEGSCRVGWAAQHVLKEPQQNHVHDKIAGYITRNPRYHKERNQQFPKDWNIVLNPNYTEKTEQQIEAEKLSMEKLNLEVNKLRNEVFDYSTTKWRSNFSFRLSIILAIVSALMLFVAIATCKATQSSQKPSTSISRNHSIIK